MKEYAKLKLMLFHRLAVASDMVRLHTEADYMAGYIKGKQEAFADLISDAGLQEEFKNWSDEREKLRIG